MMPKVYMCKSKTKYKLQNGRHMISWGGVVLAENITELFQITSRDGDCKGLSLSILYLYF